MARRIRLLPKDITISDVPGGTLLESILASGAHIRHSCNAGSCHICRAKLMNGVVTTGDGTRLEADNNTPKRILTCLCYPETDCILEIAHVLAKGELPQHTVACQILEVEPLNHDVTRYLLKFPAGKPIAYYPGQYLDLVLSPDTDGERHFPFSIANAPDNNRMLELHIRDIPGSDSLELLKQALVPGEIIHAHLPGGDCTLTHIYGDEALHSETTPLVFMAGSTGFAPVKAMIEYCFQENLSRPIMLFWGGRTRDDLYLHELATQWDQKHENFRYIPVVSEPENSPGWEGRTGFVHRALMEDLLPFDSELQIIAGGSPGMVHAAYDDFIAAGLSKHQLHSDVFAYAPR
jgi:CDP-4-dehydro-6-deoxyglucose reductase